MSEAITAGDVSLRIIYEQTVRALTRGRPAEARDSLNALADVVTDYQLAVLELARRRNALRSVMDEFVAAVRAVIVTPPAR